MANLHLRDVDDTILEQYRAEAKANKRSLQAELRDGLAEVSQNFACRQERIALSRQLTAGQCLTSDSTPHIRWSRDTDGGRRLGLRKPDADRT